MFTVIGLLVIAAFVCVIAAAAGKMPLWISVALLSIVEIVRLLPLGK